MMMLKVLFQSFNHALELFGPLTQSQCAEALQLCSEIKIDNKQTVALGQAL